MVSEPPPRETLGARAVRCRAKAARLRERAKLLGPGIAQELLDMAKDYDGIADLLESLASDRL